MELNGVPIEDTFAEAFDMEATRLVITARSEKWAYHAARTVTGFATSVIGCGLEAGIERALAPEETPDGRPGVALLFFGFDHEALAGQVPNRVGQCVMTAPTSAVFSGLDSGAPVPIGKTLRYFGDGFQISKLLGDRRFWRIPVMDGEFLCTEIAGTAPAIGGGNFLVLAGSEEGALTACEAAVEAIAELPNVVTPFPGGVVRSGSKVGSRYSSLPASTNDRYCPTLRGLTESALRPETRGVLEVVIDGLTREDIIRAMSSGITAACRAGPDLHGISAGNFGGDLGAHHFQLREVAA